MIADLVCNCTRWFKQSSWPTPRFYTVTLLWKLGRIIVPLGKKNKTVQTLILLLVDSVISFPSVATIYRKGETTGQLEIHVDVNSSPPTPPPPQFFLLHKLSINPPLKGGTGLRSRGGGNFIGPEPNNLINIAPSRTPSPLSCLPLSPSLVFRL